MVSNTTKLPVNISQTSGGKYQTFNHPNRIRYHDNNYAECHVGGKKDSLNRPATLTCTKYLTNLPVGAEATKITVKLKHSKAPYNNKDCNVQAPTVSLIDNRGKVLKSKKAQAPTNAAVENNIVFDFSVAYVNYNVINSNNFGVKVDYPANSNDNEGYVRVYYVEIYVTYKLSKYSLKLNHINGEYNGDTYIMKLDVSNINLTTYDPTLTVTAPSGFSFIGSHLSNGLVNSGYQCTVVNPRTLSILVGFGKNRASRTIILEFASNFTFATGVEYVDRTFNVSESVNGWTASKTVRITKTRPADPTITPDTPSYDPEDNPLTGDVLHLPTINVEVGKVFYFTIDLSSWDTVPDKTVYAYNPYNDDGKDEAETFLHKLENYLTYRTLDEFGVSALYIKESSNFTFPMKATEVGTFKLQWCWWDGDTAAPFQDIFVNVFPEGFDPNVNVPSCSILKLSQEECDRLGTGYNYTLQSYLKEITSDVHVRDWGKNFRIGVFNNAIPSNVTSFTYIDSETGETKVISYDGTDYDSLTTKQIVDNAEYWSNCPTTVNTYENLECQFVYNENYPLYILLVGDYNEATTPASISYTEPVIVETETYNGRETNGTYPYPILNVIGNEDSAEMNISASNNASTLITYGLPLDEDYGTNNEIAIRGLEITGTIESNTDNLILFATLKNSTNESRQRSIVLDETLTQLTDENTFSIGGIGDLWGFTTLDITNLEDWEVHLQVSNSLMDTTGQINLKNIEFIIYIETIDQQEVQTFINGEDLSYYGVFLTDRNIPEGLETDTDYLNVKGTDINDPYCQNIEEKTIEVEFEIGDNCDLTGSTNSLRQITKLLVNERDQYNRPIPKRLEFSDYPDVYWEYIMQKALTSELKISSYKVKAKLVIPAGTSYNKVATKTNSTGYINGLAHIRPIIQFKPNTQSISIKEEITGQEFQMSYPVDEWAGKIVEIDCDNRIVLLKNDDDDTTGETITAYTDFNTDWFRLLGEYNFSSTGCAIMSVEYQERW